jgi:hypothetical protein
MPDAADAANLGVNEKEEIDPEDALKVYEPAVGGFTKPEKVYAVLWALAVYLDAARVWGPW